MKKTEEQEEYLEDKNGGYVAYNDEKRGENVRLVLPRSFFGENFAGGNGEVLDNGTFHALQIDDLSELVSSNAITKMGRFIVDYSVKNPLVPVEKIKAKQEALDEIRTNDKIRQGVADVLERVRGYEGGHGYPGQGAAEFLHNYGNDYDTQGDVRTILGSLPKWAKDIPKPESAYLKGLIDNVRENLKSSSVHKLAKGPIFRHLVKGKIYGLEEVLKEGHMVSPLPFNPIWIKSIPTFIGFAGPIGTVLYTVASTEGTLPPETGFGLSFITGISAVMGGAMGTMIGGIRDKYNFLKPMRKRFGNDIEAMNAYKAIGSLDELIAYDGFRKQLPNASLPEVSDSDRHEFFAEGLVNPLQSQRIKDYVPNDVALNNGQRLTFLTGPNSGGKTSLGKSIAQAQVLGQIGCYVPATSARISVADKVFYQVGGNDTLDDEEGGLGTLFKQTKDVLFASTPKSLVVIDELIEGTTFDEKTKHTMDQLHGFLHKGPNVVYTSHHYELARYFQEKGIGNYIQVEFDGEKPTHRIIPGISSNSHSDIVAKRVGFDGEAIREHLVEKGYMKEGQSLEDYGR